MDTSRAHAPYMRINDVSRAVALMTVIPKRLPFVWEYYLNTKIVVIYIYCMSETIRTYIGMSMSTTDICTTHSFPVLAFE